MAITVVSGTDVSVTLAGANGPDMTGAVDTTGATMIELTVSSAVSATVAPTVSDNKGNTYTAHQRAAGVGAVCQKWHVYDPVVGSGHTFTVEPHGRLCGAARAGVCGRGDSARPRGDSAVNQ